MRWWCCSLLCVLQRFNLCDVVIKAVTSDRPYRCSECGKTFTSPTSLRIHLKIHSEDKPHQCSVCGKRFLWLCVLKRHQVVHKGERNISLLEDMVLCGSLVERDLRKPQDRVRNDRTVHR